MAHGRPWRSGLRGALRLLPACQMQYVQLLHMNMEDETMRQKMAQAVVAGRYRRSAMDTARSEMRLVISLEVVLLENSQLNLVLIVDSNVFKQKRFLMMLSEYQARSTRFTRVPA